jgi:large subunit ribosomal protein L5
MAQDKDDDKEKGGAAKAGGKPQLTPEQEAEAAAKKAARAEAKAKGGKVPRGKAAAAAKEVAMERVKRDGPARLRKLYDAEIRAKLMQEFSLSNQMQAPKLTRITINMGLGEAVTNPKLLDSAVDELGAITGQRPVVTRAKKSIAVFKLRAGQKIGAMVTLRREQMYEFFDRLVSFALPRVRDFKGVSPKSFDGRGNYTMGVREEIIFPEINFEKLDKPKGMNITFNTSAPNDEQARALLKHLGMPFRN